MASKYSIREIVDMAVQTEKLGYQFYTAMKGKFSNHEGLRNLFDTLSKMELNHEILFTKMLDSVGGPEPEGWEEAEHYFRAIVESEFFLGKNKSLASFDHLMTVVDAVNFAIGFEKETTLFFIGLRGAVPANEKAIVDRIIKEETSHIVWLTRFRDLEKS